MIKAYDAFCGVGGFNYGIKSASSTLGIEAEIVGACDIDKQAREIYHLNHGHMPDADIWKIEPKEMPDHDILMGGFPCQPFSKNGLAYLYGNSKLSGKDKRSNLCNALIGILEEKKPRMFLFENVSNIYKIRNADGSSFLESLRFKLNSIGYDVFVNKECSINWGVPQARERIFFVGFRSDLKIKFQFPNHYEFGTDNSNRVVADILEPNDTIDFEKYSMKKLLGKRKNHRRKEATRYDSLKVEFLKRHKRMEDGSYALKHEYRRGIENQTFDRIITLAAINGDMPSGNSRQQDRLFSRFGLCPTLLANISIPAFDTDGTIEGWRVLTPRECFRLQGFPDSFQMHKKDKFAYKQAGNSVTTNVVAGLLLEMLQSLPPEPSSSTNMVHAAEQ